MPMPLVRLIIALAVAIDVVVMLGNTSPVWASIAKGLGCKLPRATMRDAMHALTNEYSSNSASFTFFRPVSGCSARA